MKRHDSDDSPVAAKLQRFDLLKKRYINVHIIIIIIIMGFGSKCRILNGQVDYIENSKLNIADM